MRKNRKWVCALTVILALVSLQINCAVNAASDSNIKSSSAFIENQFKSNEAYARLMASYDDGNMNYDYPDYYGGAYVNDNGYLVILSKDISVNETNNVMNVCDYENVVVTEAMYSYNELMAFKEMISSKAQYAMEQRMFELNGITLSIRDNENKVFIGLEDVDNAELKEYLTDSLADSCYEFYKTQMPEDYVTLYPGDAIKSGGSGSAGCKAQMTIDGVVKTGFLTAAHVADETDVWKVGETVNTRVGSTIWKLYEGEVDAAFIEFYGATEFSNTVEAGAISAGYASPATGTVVYKKGSTSGVSSGTVVSTSGETAVWDENGYLHRFYNLLEINDSACTYGDSGGLVYLISNSKLYAVGLVKGGGDGHYYATKMSVLTSYGILVIQ